MVPLLHYARNIMSFPYTEKPMTMPAAEVDFVPAYARRPAKQKKFRTWMVLAPIGALALIGGAATVLATPEADTAAPLVEPVSAMAPVIDRTAPLPTTMSSPPVRAATSAPVVVAPSARDAAAARRSAPEVRAAPVVRAAPAERAPVTPRVEIPVEPAGPRAYSPSPTVAASPPAPSAPAPAPGPAITVAPLN